MSNEKIFSTLLQPTQRNSVSTVETKLTRDSSTSALHASAWQISEETSFRDTSTRFCAMWNLVYLSTDTVSHNAVLFLENILKIHFWTARTFSLDVAGVGNKNKLTYSNLRNIFPALKIRFLNISIFSLNMAGEKENIWICNIFLALKMRFLNVGIFS